MARFLLAVLLCLASGCEPTQPAPKPAAEQPTVIPPPDPARGDPIVWVNGHYVYAADLEKFPIEAWVAGPLIEHFARERKIEPTDEQVDRFIKAFGNLSDDDPKMKGMKIPRFMAHQEVRGWLIDKALYEKYGGTVVFEQANPFTPVGAYRALFEEAQRLNNLKFFDQAQHDAFWAYFLKDHPFQMDKRDIDYSKPWWEQERKEDRK